MNLPCVVNLSTDKAVSKCSFSSSSHIYIPWRQLFLGLGDQAIKIRGKLLALDDADGI